MLDICSIWIWTSLYRLDLPSYLRIFLSWTWSIYYDNIVLFQTKIYSNPKMSQACLSIARVPYLCTHVLSCLWMATVARLASVYGISLAYLMLWSWISQGTHSCRYLWIFMSEKTLSAALHVILIRLLYSVFVCLLCKFHTLNFQTFCIFFSKYFPVIFSYLHS